MQRQAQMICQVEPVRAVTILPVHDSVHRQGSLHRNKPMYKNRNIHHILLDAGYSMQPGSDTAMGTCEALLERFRAEAAREPETEILVGLSLFTDTLQTLYRDRPPSTAVLPGTDGYPTDGDSALYQVFQELVASLEAQWLECQAVLPTRVSLHTITDGIDTASEHTGPAEMLLLVERFKATGAWTFRFHGTDLDSLVSDAIIAIRRRYRLPEEKKLLCQALCDFFSTDERRPPSGDIHSHSGG